jgi:hypothetical protein
MVQGANLTMKQKIDEFAAKAALLADLLLELSDGLHELRILRNWLEERERQESNGELRELRKDAAMVAALKRPATTAKPRARR